MLRAAIERTLLEYESAKKAPLKSHPLAQLLTQSLPEYLSATTGNSKRYKCEGSVGKGNWAGCPWIAIFDILITDSAQSGYYPVYLFRQDMAGTYLSLNQGVTEIKKRYKEDPKRVLEIRGSDFRAQIGSIPSRFPETIIDLATDSSSNVDNDLDLADEDERDPPKGTEDLRNFRLHKRYERNQKLAAQAKKIHGYTCQACGFNFEKVYGGLGQDFIEAHHLRSLSTLKGEVVELDPRHDFATLCPNCHRMIHRFENPGNVDSFKKVIRS